MANAMYTKAKELILAGDIDLVADTIKAILIDSADYTANLTTDDYLDDVPGAARVATATLAGKSVTAGVFDATDTTFTAVTGDVSEKVLLVKDTGSDATSPLIALIDTATGLPFTPNGSDLLCTWDNGASKIFRLV